MCAKHNACQSKISVHKISPVCACSHPSAVTSVTAAEPTSGGCCSSDTDSCCSNSADPVEGESESSAPAISQLGPETRCCSDSDCVETGPDTQADKPGAKLASYSCSKAHSSGVQSRSWKVHGMDCASCARKIETAVSKLDDVSQVKVLFATEKLVVEFSEAATVARIEQTIAATGFTLQQPEQKGEATSRAMTPLAFLKQNLLVVSLAGAMAISALFEPLFPLLSHWGFFVICLIGLLPILNKAVQLAKAGSPFSIETLMSVAALGALYLGESEEAAMVLLLFLLGEKLEAFASGRARSGVKALMALIPETAVRIVDGERTQVGAGELQPGDVIEVAPGDRLPADGIIATSASFDESALTGESVPVEKQAGAAVMAGSVLVDRVTRYQVTSEQGSNAVDRILHLIEEADSHKAPMERFLDRFSRWYTPLMMLVSLLVIITPPLLFAQPWETWLYRGLALLLIACPCALVISTPAAITSGLAAASRRGILIKGGAALEQLGAIEMVVFDKTGTLTKGEPLVTDIIALAGLSAQDILRTAAAIELGSNHPLAQAIVAESHKQELDVLEAELKEVLPGAGVQGVLNGIRYKLSAPAQLDPLITATVGQQISVMESSGKTVTVLLRAEEVVGLIALQDTVRPDAAAAVNNLSAMGIDSVMLTGDNPRSAQSIAEQIGISYRAGLLPEDKITHMQEMAAGRHVAMVGDGINDAPAMKVASVGIAMGGGTDVALETADAALSHSRLTEVAGMIRLSRAALRNIRQNVALALGLKGVFLVTSVLGITGLWMAVLADSGATVLVTLNALRLLRLGNTGE